MKTKLAVHFNNLISKSSGLNFEDRAFGLTFLLAVIMLARNLDKDCRELDSSKFDFLCNYSKTLAPRCYAVFNKISAELISSDLDFITSNTFDHLSQSDSCDIFAISDFYLISKEAHRKKSSLTAIDKKIGGSDLLHRTQFFTEPYMATALVLSSLKAFESRGISKDQIVILDPAVGAGNILLSALEVLSTQEAKSKEERLKIIDSIFNRLVGYDLDPMMKEISSLSLCVAYSAKTDCLPLQKPKILSGEINNITGYLDSENCIALDSATPQGPRLLVTNPPYLGKRMMDERLREFIKTRFPSCKGDMCASFMLRCAQSLRQGDVLALVHQNTYFHLTSLDRARVDLESIANLRTTVNLGTGAFDALSGEKTNISLSIFEKNAPDLKQPVFISIADLPYIKKKEVISKSVLLENITNTHQNQISSFIDGHTVHYKSCAKPMQGSSTGNNEQMVKFVWEKSTEDFDWVLASKGGGYARWWGLNRFIVYWGSEGKRIKEQKGSALRNLDKQEITHLVYSDTGSSGLNARLKRTDQVFMASGPGIIVENGNKYAHLAFLNSRLATYFLRIINPKLTVSAGYLGKLPFNQDISNNKKLSTLGGVCVSRKKEWLSNKLISADTNIKSMYEQSCEDFNAYFENTLKTDLYSELEKLKAEAEIEHEVSKVFGITNKLQNEITRNVGYPAYAINQGYTNLPSDILDKGLSRHIGTNLTYKNGVKLPGGISADGPLEALAFTLSINPNEVAEMILKQAPQLSILKAIYLEDKLHKTTLNIFGFNDVRDWIPLRIRIDEVVARFNSVFPYADSELNSLNMQYKTIKTWIENRLLIVHNQSFSGRPILFIKDNFIELDR